VKTIGKISYWLDRVIRTLISLFLAGMTIVLVIQVIQRSIFQDGIVWADELARFLMIAMVFFGAAVAIRDKTHITVSIFEDWKPEIRKWLAPIQWTVILIYAGILLKVGIDTLDIVGPQRSPNMGISMGLAYSVIPISTAFMILHLLFRMNKRKNPVEEDE